MAVRPYFATLPPYSVELARACMEKVDRFYTNLPQSRAYQRAKRIRQLYYGLPGEASPFDVSVVGVAGEAGELSQVHINRVHHLGQRILTMTVGEDFGWQPEAANGDAASQEEAIIASSVLEYEKRDKRLRRYLRTLAEMCLLDSESWGCVRWDAAAGAVYDTTADGLKVHEGKLKVTAHPFFRVVVNTSRHDAAHSWVILTEFVNRYDLAARHPKHAERILRLGADHRLILDWRRSARGFEDDDTEEVPVYTLFHRQSPAVPQGREVIFCDADTVLYDGPSVWGDGLPCFRLAPGDMLDTPGGSTPLTDIAAPQQVLNMLVSSAVTNNANGAVANIAAPRASNVSVTQLEGGQNYWEYDGDRPPEPITFTATAKETFDLAKMMSDFQAELVGLNAVSMGNGSPELSGAAMALLDSKSLQYLEGFAQTVNEAKEDLGTAILDRYRRFAKTPRRLELIVGNGRKRLLERFTGKSIGEHMRVTVKLRSALTDTAAGKLDMVEKLITIGAFKPTDAPKLVNILRTGQWDTILEGPEREELLIADENEKMREGVCPPVDVTDPHMQHIYGHRPVGASTEFRMDEGGNPTAAMLAYTQHQQMHIDALRNTDPGLLQVLGQPFIPPPMAPPPVGPDGAPLPPPGPEAPPPGPPEAPGETLEPADPNLPRMPSMPELPEGAPPPALP